MVRSVTFDHDDDDGLLNVHLCPALSDPHPDCLSPSLVAGKTLSADVEKDLTSFIALTRQMVRMERSRQGMSFRATL